MHFSEYKDYLLQHNLAPEKIATPFVRWVQRFIASNPSPLLSSSKKVKQFLQNLEEDPTIQKWQLEQAEKAVQLYVQLFLKNVTSVSDCQDTPLDAIYEKLKTVLRLKHYALRTEKTYTD